MSEDVVISIDGDEVHATKAEFHEIVKMLDSYGFNLFFEKFLQPISDDVIKQVDEGTVTKDYMDDFIAVMHVHALIKQVSVLGSQIQEQLKTLDVDSQK